jgi:hypothetical protein
MRHLVPLYKHIAQALEALSNCRNRGADGAKWASSWEDRLEKMQKLLPSGSGYDTRALIDMIDIKPNRFIITGDYHRMDDNGSYNGWIKYKIVVSASLGHDFEIKVAGGNADFKEYTAELFRNALRLEMHGAEFCEETV